MPDEGTIGGGRVLDSPIRAPIAHRVKRNGSLILDGLEPGNILALNTLQAFFSLARIGIPQPRLDPIGNMRLKHIKADIGQRKVDRPQHEIDISAAAIVGVSFGAGADGE